MEIYSNLSLQVINYKNVEYNYDEYFSFNKISKSKIKIIYIDYNFKPILDYDIFKIFLSKINDKDYKIIFIVNDLDKIISNNHKKELSSIIANYNILHISIETILGNNYIQETSSINFDQYQFPYSFNQIKLLKKYFGSLFEYQTKPKIKVICVDFDKTLWDGIAGEEENLKNIFNSSSYLFSLFQTFLINQKNKGRLLCLVTKNNKDTIYEFFKKNKTIITINDFIIIKANWEKKSTNIKEISKMLSLNTDSFVFIDDSDFEIEEVNKNIKNIRTIKFINEYSYFIKEILNNPIFIKNKLTKEDKLKTLSYKQEINRKVSIKKTDNKDYFNESIFNLLEVKLKYKKNEKIDISRVSQMSEKTNQFNFFKKELNTKKIKEIIKKKYNIFTCQADDKYGKYGVIGYIIIKNNIVDNFVISCRALGRSIEYKFFDYCINNQNLKKEIFLKYKKNKRNVPSKIFIDSLKKYYEKKNKNKNINIIH